MSKQLLIMRHAKSSWTEEGKTDFERSLNKRGRRVAPLMGQLIADERVIPDKIISSSAVRAKQTTELFIEGCKGIDPDDVRFVKFLYHAPASEYLETLERFDDEECQTLMFVGHNPGLEELIYQLSKVHETVPTATIARFDFGDSDWISIRSPFKATLVDVWRHKDVGID